MKSGSRLATTLLTVAAGLAACGGGGNAPTTGASSSNRAPTGSSTEAWFVDEAVERGLLFEHRSGHHGDYFMPEIMGGGAALFDMDGDGDLDAYLVQSGSLHRTRHEAGPGDWNRLFENLGDGRFRDVTQGSGAQDPRYGMGVACGDVDGDGDTDLYVTNVGRDTLLLNEGGGTFRDATRESGLGHRGWGTSAVFFDADGDGWLDLFVTNYLDWSMETELPCMDTLSRADYCSPKNYKTPAQDLFFRNRGDGTFEDASEASGVHAVPGNGLGVASGDFDGDGQPDLFVANDGMPDALWINQGEGRFENRALAWGCATDLNGLNKAGMGVAIGDLDGDLDLDVMVCNLRGESDSMFLNEKGRFSDHTARGGLAAVSKPFTRFGMGWVDLDNDGLLDLFQANGRVARAREGRPGEDPYAEENLLFRGDGAGGFHEVTPRGGVTRPSVLTSRAAVFGDVNGDGALDILVVNRDAGAELLMSTLATRAANPGNWILLDVRERSGAPALGATLEVEVGERTVRKDVRAGYGYLSSHDPRVHLGLGTATGIDGGRVRWSDGARERFGPLPAGGVHRLTRSVP